ncbi:unnamed protein product [Oikopleura dioica]|uniref:Uncharacterized protein n=1 Tax=Oikopleura dioica TaxID=34765 RepID=E4XP10_OIKDI|nr:unnamed protein product [Oikopleura dioica]
MSRGARHDSKKWPFREKPEILQVKTQEKGTDECQKAPDEVRVKTVRKNELELGIKNIEQFWEKKSQRSVRSGLNKPLKLNISLEDVTENDTSRKDRKKIYTVTDNKAKTNLNEKARKRQKRLPLDKAALGKIENEGLRAIIIPPERDESPIKVWSNTKTGRKVEILPNNREKEKKGRIEGKERSAETRWPLDKVGNRKREQENIITKSENQVQNKLTWPENKMNNKNTNINPLNSGYDKMKSLSDWSRQQRNPLSESKEQKNGKTEMKAETETINCDKTENTTEKNSKEIKNNQGKQFRMKPLPEEERARQIALAMGGNPPPATQQTRDWTADTQTRESESDDRQSLVPAHAYRMAIQSQDRGHGTYKDNHQRNQGAFPPSAFGAFRGGNRSGHRGRGYRGNRGYRGRRRGNYVDRQPPRETTWSAHGMKDEGIEEETVTEPATTDPRDNERSHFKVGVVEGEPQYVYAHARPDNTTRSYEMEFTYIGEDGSQSNDYISVQVCEGNGSKIQLRHNESTENVLAKSYVHNSPGTVTNCIFQDPLILAKNLCGLKNWSTFWCSDKGFFTDYTSESGAPTGLYANNIRRIVVPRSKIYPKEWQGKEWRNMFLTNIKKNCFQDTLNCLGIQLTKGRMCGLERIWFYRGQDGTGEMFSWDWDTPTDLNGNDIVIVACQMSNNWAALCLMFFCRDMFSKLEPARHYRNAQQFCASMINQKTFDPSKTSEWSPYANINRTQGVIYTMLNYALSIIDHCSYFVTIKEQKKITRLGVVSLTEIMSPNSKLMNSLRFPNEDERKTFMRLSNGYNKSFRATEPWRTSGHDESWRIVSYPEEIFTRKPESMKETCERLVKEMESLYLSGEIGHDVGTTEATMKAIERNKEKQIETQVKRATDQMYLKKIEDHEEYKNHYSRMQENVKPMQDEINKAVDEKVSKIARDMQEKLNEIEKTFEAKITCLMQENQQLKQNQEKNALTPVRPGNSNEGRMEIDLRENTEHSDENSDEGGQPKKKLNTRSHDLTQETLQSLIGGGIPMSTNLPGN